MSTTRRWFTYGGNDTLLQQQDTSNYAASSFFPACTTTGTLICAIYGIYSPAQYDNHPAPLSANLQSYIVDANSANAAKPSGTGQKRYVYVKSA